MYKFNRILIQAFLFFTVATLSSCEKLLEMPLKDKIPQEGLFKDEQGFIDALTGVYLGMDKPAGFSGNGLYTQSLSMGTLSVLANNYNNAPTSQLDGAFYGSVARYDYEAASVKQEIGNIWKGMYTNVANLNNILKYIDGKKGVFYLDRFNRVKGEAIALRGLLHFDVARMYGQSPVVGMNQRAIPYVRVFGGVPTAFSTLEAALDSTIFDLTQAKDLLSQTDTTKIREGSTDLFAAYTQNHMNYWAAKALLARVYLYKGDYTNALKMAQEVIGSNKFPLSTSNVAVSSANIRDRLFSKELIFSLYSTSVFNTNGSLFGISSPSVPLQLALANRNTLYGNPSVTPVDWRHSWFDANGSNVIVPSKYFQNANLPYAIQNIVPVIRVSEMYYIAAECLNSLGNAHQGLAYLNKVRQARGLNPLTTINVPDGAALSIEITKEYKKEFVQEGQTFFYFKRLNKDLKVESGTTMVVPSNAYVFPIPDRELEYNP